MSRKGRILAGVLPAGRDGDDENSNLALNLLRLKITINLKFMDSHQNNRQFKGLYKYRYPSFGQESGKCHSTKGLRELRFKNFAKKVGKMPGKRKFFYSHFFVDRARKAWYDCDS